MRILFDQGTPVPLRELLGSHQVETAFERGWSTLTNGELLAAAEQEGFDVFLTAIACCSSADPLVFAIGSQIGLAVLPE